MNRHEDKRNFKCKECGRGFNYNSNLKAHMVVHSGVKPFKCDICPKAYTRAAELRHHQATVHEGKNLNKFFCKFCNKGFSHVTNLRHHVYTHTGEKPYKCHLCDAAFTTNQSLKFHKKKVHSLTEPESGHKIGKYKDPENLEKGLQCNFSSDEENEVEVYTQAIDEEIQSATVKVQEINDENVIYLNLSDLDDAESFIAIIEAPMEIQTSQ
ncbi:hypothetical protein KUTeg_001009 [Tegillarca granosa]|uniref:C2H2-type domain-containing protein n=1 Tax=Tegillarca granosa TaxID=220873 RepID=A0ABQ9FW07_TEGGR|nr:hypothetical protein KUTeg_001009 [Tegillarca granosa]